MARASPSSATESGSGGSGRGRACIRSRGPRRREEAKAGTDMTAIVDRADVPEVLGEEEKGLRAAGEPCGPDGGGRIRRRERIGGGEDAAFAADQRAERGRGAGGAEQGVVRLAFRREGDRFSKCQALAPPVGSVEVITSPLLSTARQASEVGQEIPVICTEPPGVCLAPGRPAAGGRVRRGEDVAGHIADRAEHGRDAGGSFEVARTGRRRRQLSRLRRRRSGRSRRRAGRRGPRRRRVKGCRRRCCGDRARSRAGSSATGPRPGSSRSGSGRRWRCSTPPETAAQNAGDGQEIEIRWVAPFWPLPLTFTADQAPVPPVGSVETKIQPS